MINQCDCIVMSKHDTRCSRLATKRCTTCGDKLCRPCAKQHHAHTTIEALNPPPVKTT